MDEHSSLTALLDRAAARPARDPDVDGPYRAARRRRVAAASTVAVAVAGASFAVAIDRPGPSTDVQTTMPTAPPWTEYRDEQAGFSLPIAAGWQRSSGPLAPWLTNPRERLSLATVPTEPIDAPGNQAVCPSEIPRAGVERLRADDVYLWLGEYSPPGNPLFANPNPRPKTFAKAGWSPLCELGGGLTAEGFTFSDGGREFHVTVVLGADVPADRRAALYATLDGLQFDPLEP
jgi:hypothetical protein